MLFVHRRPHPPLDAFIESVWFSRNEFGTQTLQRVLPTGGPQLIVNLAEDATRLYEYTSRGISRRTLPGTTVTGITTRAQIIDTAEQEYVAGVAFRPGGTKPFFACSASELADTDVPIECLWGRSSVQRLRDRLLQQISPLGALDVLEASLFSEWTRRELHPAVEFALRAFGQSPLLSRVQAVTDSVALSPKRFIERFKTEVGVTPKQYCRLLRFQHAVKNAHRRQVDWAQLALECGYFDQAHFIHEFKSFSGLTPSGYQVASTEFQNHVNFLQSPESAIV